jgi:hypothetical protein
MSGICHQSHNGQRRSLTILLCELYAICVDSRVHRVIAFDVQADKVDLEVRTQERCVFSGVFCHARFSSQSVDQW